MGGGGGTCFLESCGGGGRKIIKYIGAPVHIQNIVVSGKFLPKMKAAYILYIYIYIYILVNPLSCMAALSP
jgi:hypothetical protein